MAAGNDMVRVDFTGRYAHVHGQYGPGDGAAFPRPQALAIVDAGYGHIVTAPQKPPVDKQVKRPPVPQRTWLTKNAPGRKARKRT